MSEFVLQTFRTCKVSEHMNHSVICLLPKQQRPESISQLRPICLSNVVIKIVSKIIANRVKRVIGDLGGEWQAGFIPNRQANDNVVIAQEIIHSLRHKHDKRGMVVKIDLEKAYDCIDWTFLVDVLKSVGFRQEIITIIKSCLESTTLSEVLRQRIQKVVADKRWKAPYIGRRRLQVSHLFFADDFLLFGEASMEQDV